MKKLLAFLLVISLVFMLVACGPQNDDPNNNGDNPSNGDNTGNKDNPFGDNNNPIDTPIVDIDPTE